MLVILLAQALAFQCYTSSTDKTKTMECGGETSAACYMFLLNDGSGGEGACIPLGHPLASQADIDGLFCANMDANGGMKVCSCSTDLCNDPEVLSAAPMSPSCYVGVAGLATGPECENGPPLMFGELDQPRCESRGVSGCVEANEDRGQSGHCTRKQTSEECVAVTNRDEWVDGEEQQGAGDSCTDDNDGRGCCQWLPAKTAEEAAAECAADQWCTMQQEEHCCDECTCEPRCVKTDAANEVENNRQSAMCRGRARETSACVENNSWQGEAEHCTSLTTQDGCEALLIHSDPSTGPRACNVNVQGSTTEWEEGPCCQWLAAVEDVEATCLADGLCTLRAGGRDSISSAAEMIPALFEYGLFTPGPAPADNRCVLSMSMKNGHGSLIGGGADLPGDLKMHCDAGTREGGQFHSLFEHVGGTPEFWQAYCRTMTVGVDTALATKKPSEVLAGLKAMQLDDLDESARDNLYIYKEFAPVEGQYEELKCAFMERAGAVSGGAGFCVCKGSQCNGAGAIAHVINSFALKVLQMIDGSLLPIREDANAVVPGLIDENGKFNVALVPDITQENLEAFARHPDNVYFTLAELEDLKRTYEAMQAAQAAAEATTSAPTTSAPTSAPTTSAPTSASGAVPDVLPVVQSSLTFSGLNVAQAEAIKPAIRAGIASSLNVEASQVRIDSLSRRLGEADQDQSDSVTVAFSVILAAGADTSAVEARVQAVDSAAVVTAIQVEVDKDPAQAQALAGAGGDLAAVTVVVAAPTVATETVAPQPTTTTGTATAALSDSAAAVALLAGASLFY